MFGGTERFFRPGYRAHLVSEWLLALDGVVPKLEAGATVADVGCGHGASTVIMAQAYPASRFFGFDYHAPSIETAKQRAADGEVADRVTFARATAKTYPNHDYDLICFFDCLHDMGDPVGAARHAYQTLKADGTVLLVEPFAGDHLDENLSPVGRLFYAASTFVSSVRRIRCPRRSALGWARRQGRLGCGASSWRRALRASAGRRQRRSTSFLKRVDSTVKATSRAFSIWASTRLVR